MKVLYIIPGGLNNIGAASKYYYPVALSNEGAEVGVLGKANSGVESALLESNVQVFAEDWKNSVQFLKTLKHILSEFQPDIVHVYFFRFCFILPFLKGVFPKIKWAVDIRSPLLKTGIKRPLFRLLNHFEVKTYHKIFAHGINSAETVIGRRNKVHLLPAGVDLNNFTTNNNRSIKYPPLKLIYTGSLNRVRELDNLIKAVHVVSKKLSIQLDMFGDGNDKQRLQNLVVNLGLKDVVNFKGKVLREDLYATLCNYHIGLGYVGAKIFYTAPSLKTLEFLAAGLPVVANDTSGHREYVKDGENGVLADKDPDSFAQGILRLSESDLWEKTAANAKQSIISYDWRALVRSFLVPEYYQLIDMKTKPLNRYIKR